MLSSLFSSLALAATASAAIFYAGVAESGGEFGVFSPTATVGTGLPGRFGVDYAFINESTVDIFVDENGINLFRVAFLLERMCPLSFGLGSKFNETYFSEYKAAIDYITITKGAYSIFDPHNYMRYNNPSQQPETGSIIGDTTDPAAATTEQFREFWHELASRFVDNEKVIFGIMNEPHDMNTSLLLENDQAAIDGIRASGARQLILAPGNGFTGGHSWLQDAGGDAPSSEFMHLIRDPINNTAIDIHEYLDFDFSGSHSVCNASGPANLAGLTEWLHTFQLKAMITEFGGDNNTMCYELLDQLIEYMAVNDEYIGWTAWAAGPLWGDNSPCCTDSRQLGSLEPNSVASDGSPSLYETVWLRAIQRLVPKNLQRSGISSIHGPAGIFF